MTIRIAATVAACTAIACGGHAPAPAPPAPIGNTAKGNTVVVEPPTEDPRCRYAGDGVVPGGPGKPDLARGIIVDALGHPIDGAAVTITGAERHETRQGHDLTVIQGQTSTWTDASGVFTLGGLSQFMDQITVEFGGIKVTCTRELDGRRAYEIEVAPPAV